MKTQTGRWRGDFSYQVDYNDHFETPLVAYQDILSALDVVAKGKDRKDHVLYDPYYCNGRTAVYLKKLGFGQVQHAKRDFYKDISNKSVPVYDTLITNPPYSDTHKERCLQFCVEQFRKLRRPFFLLMPNYVAARSYYRRILGDTMKDVMYLLPSEPYEYDHPEGTGHSVSPFKSLWFCGVGEQHIPTIESAWRDCKASSTLIASLEELESRRAIPTEKRPNPRQRKKRQKSKFVASPLGSASGIKQTAHKASTPVPKPKHPAKSSRYRDKNGKRTKKRF